MPHLRETHRSKDEQTPAYAGPVARRAGIAAAVISLSLPAGCVDSSPEAGNITVNPGDLPAHAAAVTGPALSGTVRNQAGKPAPGATVTVTLLRSKAERASVGIGAAFSLGLSCFVEKRGCRAPTSHGPVAQDGSFAVAMPTNNGEPPIGVAISVVGPASPGDPDSRVGTALELPATAATGATVDVPLAATPAQLKTHGSQLQITMPTVAGTIKTGPTTVTVSQLPAEGDVSDATTDLTTTPVKLPFDLRLGEDSRLLIAAAQPAKVGKYTATLSATRVLAGANVPGSRGAACTVTDSQGKARKQKPCGLTDGALGVAWTPDDDPTCVNGPCPGTAQHDHRDVLITLRKPVDATLLVVRGCGFTCTVTVSADGKHFRDLPAPQTSGTSGFYVQKLSGPAVRYVRVQTATGGFFTALREVSVFA
jgi:hypothetical protein